MYYMLISNNESIHFKSISVSITNTNTSLRAYYANAITPCILSSQSKYCNITTGNTFSSSFPYALSSSSTCCNTTNCNNPTGYCISTGLLSDVANYNMTSVFNSTGMAVSQSCNSTPTTTTSTTTTTTASTTTTSVGVTLVVTLKVNLVYTAAYADLSSGASILLIASYMSFVWNLYIFFSK